MMADEQRTTGRDETPRADEARNAARDEAPGEVAEHHGEDVGSEDESSGGFEEQRLARIAEVDALREQGVEPWPVGFRPDTTLAALREQHGGLDAGAETGVTVVVAGRITLLRSFGRLAFATIRDTTGDIQLFVPRQALGKEGFERFSQLRAGDYVGVTGEVVTTKKGELSVKPVSFVLLAKCLRPLPEKWHGLKDPEERGRQRHLDLIVNPESRRIALSRARVLQTIREEMTVRDFVEVEGPVLLTVPAGAAAKPFDTHHRALDLPLYLRIALELPLKRVVVGGLERVFEVGRVFRNEGISPRHNPEFTMMESYSAFDDYHDLMTLTEELVAACAVAVCGSTEIEVGGRPLDLTPPWKRVTMLGALRELAGVEVSLHMPEEEIRATCKAAGAQLAPNWGPGKVVMETYDQLVEKQLWGPVFVCDHPAEVSPLARPHRDDPLHVERFEAVVAGRELGNAYTELADPILQRERLDQQAEYREAGDEEAERIDEEFLAALEYGMPPTGGLGLGIDRLVMVLADVENIRDVILFPTYRPR